MLNIKDLSNVSIDNYSDNDLITYAKGFQSGLSKSQLFKLVSDRGLPDSEIANCEAGWRSLIRSNPIIIKINASHKVLRVDTIYDIPLQNTILLQSLQA